MCPENEELANYLLQKRQELADKPKGITENNDMTLSKAYNNICKAQHPIKTLKDLKDIKYALFFFTSSFSFAFFFFEFEESNVMSLHCFFFPGVVLGIFRIKT